MTEFDDIQQMLALMEEHGLEEFELEKEGTRIRLRKRSGSAAPAVAGAQHVTQASAAASSVAADDGLRIVKSPIVGTFFRAAEPGADPFVEVGMAVKKGQVLCIIEAMKLMNEIDAEESGTIISIDVENGQPVQYGERLFAIQPT
jgi:acetyl-CoA carboxylase biotin carboxyl carrier protein